MSISDWPPATPATPPGLMYLPYPSQSPRKGAQPGQGWAGLVLSCPVPSLEPVPKSCAVSSRAPSRITSRGTSSRGTSCVMWQRRCQEVSPTCTRTCPGAVVRATSRLSRTGTWVSSCPPSAWPGAAEKGGEQERNLGKGAGVSISYARVATLVCLKRLHMSLGPPACCRPSSAFHGFSAWPGPPGWFSGALQWPPEGSADSIT